MIKLIDILAEIKILNPSLKIYTVYLQYDNRIDNNFLIRAKNEEEAINIALNNIGQGWEGDELTDENASLLDKDWLETWEDEDWYKEFLENSNEEAYCYDSGT